MPWSAFDAQLDVLAAEYTALEDENCRLRVLLRNGSFFHERWGDVTDRCGGLSDCILQSVPLRTFQQEVLHGVALEVEDADFDTPTRMPSESPDGHRGDKMETSPQPEPPSRSSSSGSAVGGVSALKSSASKRGSLDAASDRLPDRLPSPRVSFGSSAMVLYGNGGTGSRSIMTINVVPSDNQGEDSATISEISLAGPSPPKQLGAARLSTSSFDSAVPVVSSSHTSDGGSTGVFRNSAHFRPHPDKLEEAIDKFGEDEKEVREIKTASESTSRDKTGHANAASTRTTVSSRKCSFDADSFGLQGRQGRSQTGSKELQLPGRSQTGSKESAPDPPADIPSRLYGRRSSRASTGSQMSSVSLMSDLSMPSSVYLRKPEPMFANLEAMKAKVRAQLMSAEYNVADYYKEVGMFQAVARSQVFDTVSLAVIFLNAIWVAIDTDFNKSELLSDAPLVFQVVEYFFCTYFTFEVIIRFSAFRFKKDCLFDRWFIFDTGLVVLMVLDTWVINLALQILSSGTEASSAQIGNASILRMARLLRLTRMARCIRLLRAMPELQVLLKGMAAAARSVFYTLVLLCALLYVFGIAFTQLLANEDVGREHFGTVLESMHTLWLYAALLDEITTLVTQMKSSGVWVLLLLDTFILLSALTVMNMLVGVLCEVVSAVAAAEKEQSSLSLVKSKVERIFYELGLDKGQDQEDKMMISKEEFISIVENREAARAIQDLGVDVLQMVDMADTLFASDDDSGDFKQLSFGEFMDAVQQMRGTNFATVKDLVNLRKALITQLTKQTSMLADMNKVNSEMARRSSFSGGAADHRRASFRRGSRTLPNVMEKAKSEGAAQGVSVKELASLTSGSKRSSGRSRLQPMTGTDSLQSIESVNVPQDAVVAIA